MKNNNDLENAYGQIVQEGIFDKFKAGASRFGASAGQGLKNIKTTGSAAKNLIKGDVKAAQKTLGGIKSVSQAGKNAAAKSFVKGTGSKLSSAISKAVVSLEQVQPILSDFINDTSGSVDINPTVAKNLGNMSQKIQAMITDLKNISASAKGQHSMQRFS